MGRKTQITREMILEAAFGLLDESGIGAVGIKSIAERLNCSTQPISWQFGSMAELKKELYFYAGAKMWGSIESEMADKDAVEAFFVTGVHYISVACDHPNVFRFIHMEDLTSILGEQEMSNASIFTKQFDQVAVDHLASEYKVPKRKIGAAVQDAVIYTHGLAAMMISDNFRLDKKDACKMVFNMGIKLLNDIGIDTQGRKFRYEV